MSEPNQSSGITSGENVAVVHNESDVKALIQKYEMETSSKFIVYYSDKSFGSNGKLKLILNYTDLNCRPRGECIVNTYAITCSIWLANCFKIQQKIFIQLQQLYSHSSKIFIQLQQLYSHSRKILIQLQQLYLLSRKIFVQLQRYVFVQLQALKYVFKVSTLKIQPARRL